MNSTCSRFSARHHRMAREGPASSLREAAEVKKNLRFDRNWVARGQLDRRSPRRAPLAATRPVAGRHHGVGAVNIRESCFCSRPDRFAPASFPRSRCPTIQVRCSRPVRLLTRPGRMNETAISSLWIEDVRVPRGLGAGAVSFTAERTMAIVSDTLASVFSRQAGSVPATDPRKAQLEGRRRARWGSSSESSDASRETHHAQGD